MGRAFDLGGCENLRLCKVLLLKLKPAVFSLTAACVERPPEEGSVEDGIEFRLGFGLRVSMVICGANEQVLF